MSTIKTGPSVSTVATPAPALIQGPAVPAEVVITPVTTPLSVGFSPNLTALNETLSNAQATLQVEQRANADKAVLTERVEGLINTLTKPEVKAAEPLSAPELDPGVQFRAVSLTATPEEWRQAFAALDAPPKAVSTKNEYPPLLMALMGGDVESAKKHVGTQTEDIKAIMENVRALNGVRLSYVRSFTDKDSLAVRKSDEADEEGEDTATVSRVVIPGPDIVQMERALPKVDAISAGLASGADIDTLVTLMMMEMEKEATKDLREMLGEMKAINAKKQAMRERIHYVKAQQTKLAEDMRKRYDERTKLPDGDPRRIDRNKLTYEQFEASQMASLASGALQDDEFKLAVSPNEQNYNQKPPPAPKVAPGAAPGAPGTTETAPPTGPAPIPHSTYSNGKSHGENVLFVANSGDVVYSKDGNSPNEAKRRAIVAEALSRIAPGSKSDAEFMVSSLLKAFAGLAYYDGDEATQAENMITQCKNEMRAFLEKLPPDQKLAVAQYWQLVLVDAERDAAVMHKSGNQDADIMTASRLPKDPRSGGDRRDNLEVAILVDGKGVRDYEDMSGKWGNLAFHIGEAMRGGFLNDEINRARDQAKALPPPPAPAPAGPFVPEGYKDPPPKSEANKFMDSMGEFKAKSVLPKTTAAVSAATKNDAKYAALPQVSANEVSMRQVSDYIDKLNGDKDSLSELSETMSMRLQMYQDRRSKFVSTLSNLLKKQSETSAGIIGNLK